MIRALLFAVILCLGMLLSCLPGRYDAFSSTLSWVLQVARHASLLLTPVGLA